MLLLSAITLHQVEAFLQSYLAIVASVSGLIAAIILFRTQVKQILTWMYGKAMFFKNWLLAPSILLRRLDEQDVILKQIRSQVFPNGGASLSDRLDKVFTLAKKAERRSLILTENTEIATFECDEEGLCVWGNTALSNLFGMDRAELLGTQWLKAIDSNDKAHVWKTWQESIKMRIPYSCEYTVVNQRTGKRIRCFATADIPPLHDGKIVFIHGVVSPIEED